MAGDTSISVWVNLKVALDDALENDSGDTCRTLAEWIIANMATFIDSIPENVSKDFMNEFNRKYFKI